MKLITKAQISLLLVKDISSYTRFYALLGSDAPVPQVPKTKTPPIPWTSTEPKFDSLKTALYYVDETTYSDGSFSYSAVNRSSQMDAVKNLNDMISGINSNISSMQDTIRQTKESIRQKADEIIATVGDTYVTQKDMQSIKDSIQSSITQAGSDIRMDFTQMINEVSGTVDSHQMSLEEYIRFNEGTIELGKVGNQMKTILSNKQLSFQQNGVDVAYISDNALKITNAEIDHTLSLGQSEKGWFDFIPRSNGNLSVKWRSSVLGG